LYTQRAYGINHIAEKAMEGLQRQGRINSVLDSNKGKYVNSGRKKKKKIILKQRPEIGSLSSTLEKFSSFFVWPNSRCMNNVITQFQ
jgi:hypothetical protein